MRIAHFLASIGRMFRPLEKDMDVDMIVGHAVNKWIELENRRKAEMTKKYLELLGHEVRDVVSGMEGVVESVCFELYGCVQMAVRPRVPKDAKPGEYPDGRWFDEKRLLKISSVPVMQQPVFAEPSYAPNGPADKPQASRTPPR